MSSSSRSGGVLGDEAPRLRGHQGLGRLVDAEHNLPPCGRGTARSISTASAASEAQEFRIRTACHPGLAVTLAPRAGCSPGRRPRSAWSPCLVVSASRSSRSASLLFVAARCARRLVPVRGDRRAVADIVSLGGVDLARDGAGGGRLPQARRRRRARLRRRASSAAHGGAPERVDVGIVAAATDAGDRGGRRPAAWSSPGSPATSVYGSFAPGGTPGPLSAPRAARRPVAADQRRRRHGHQRHRLRDLAGRAAAASTSALRGCRARRGRRRPRRWTSNPADAAGAGARRPRVAVAAEGNAVVTWGEARQRRRAPAITGLNLSSYPQDLGADIGHGGAGGAPTRRTSTSRTTARSPGWCSARTSAAARARSRGGSSALPFDAPGALDGGPRRDAAGIAMDERGVGQARSRALERHASWARRSTRRVQPGRPRLGAAADAGRQVGGLRAPRIAVAWRYRATPGRGPLPHEAEGARARGAAVAARAAARCPAGQLRDGRRPRSATSRWRCSRATRARAALDGGGVRPAPGRALHHSSTRFQAQPAGAEGGRPGLDLWGTQTLPRDRSTACWPGDDATRVVPVVKPLTAGGRTD